MRPTSTTAVGLVVLLAGCATHQTREVARDPRGVVSLVSRAADPGGASFDHPHGVRPPALEQLLGALRYERGRLGVLSEGGPVLDPGEAAWLAPRLAEALSRATPGEQVEFRVMTRRLGVAYWADEVTSGALHVERGRLHLAIGDVRRGPVVDMNGDRVPAFEGDPFRDSPGVFTLVGPPAAQREAYNHVAIELRDLAPQDARSYMRELLERLGRPGAAAQGGCR